MKELITSRNKAAWQKDIQYILEEVYMWYVLNSASSKGTISAK